MGHCWPPTHPPHVTTEHGQANHFKHSPLSVLFLTSPRPAPLPVMAAPQGHGPGLAEPRLPPTATAGSKGRGGSGEQPYHTQVPSTCAPPPSQCCWGTLRELQVRAGLCVPFHP